MDLILSNLPALFITAFFAILFLQAGFDKLLNYQGNLDYFRDHFKSSPLSDLVRLLLPTITVLEILTGVVSALAFLLILFRGQSSLANLSPILAALSLLGLFLGQRLAKDYAGAASLTPYFVVALLGLWMIKM